MENNEVTLLSRDDVLNDKKFGSIKKKYDRNFHGTDFAILTGARDNCSSWMLKDKQLFGMNYKAICTNYDDEFFVPDNYGKNELARPVMSYEKIINIGHNINTGDIIEYGEYPQSVVSKEKSKILDEAHSKGELTYTDKVYTVDGVFYEINNKEFSPMDYYEFLYNNEKYIIVYPNITNTKGYCVLSDGNKYSNDDTVWIKVEPIKWYVDKREKRLISVNGLISGISPYSTTGSKDFNTTDIYKFLNVYFKNQIGPSVIKKDISNIKKINFNPYNFSYDDISEEDIIEGAISSGVTVFLHGKSSEGKTARVKELDPTCEVLSLCSATPERLNGKSVYVSDTGEMKDIPPAWLVRLNDKCKREPDRLHILFLDELTNALPSIQGMAYDIVLERRVNDLWDLPENARVVCAGNEMEDSIAANQLAEPLFNRCAHVYIKTTTDKWLEWASNNNIHPAIISYIAYTGGEALRSKFDGKSPNADPRKWEMASKMLYKTNNPLMLRSLVGEDITREFTNFCSSHCITMEDVLNGNYTSDEIATLNTSERYITTASLTGVGEDKLDIIRSFVSKLGSEYLALFDSLWAHGDEARLERIADARLGGKSK